MATAIETFLYGDLANVVSDCGSVGEHLLAEIRLAEDLISLRIASEQLPYVFRWVHFREAYLGFFQQHASEPDELQLPWGIVGFYCEQLDADRWHFNLNCSHTRWSWESLWPEVETTAG